jgi:hypothetical protein
MNNLKEPNPLPNGIQESSEDPLGFIYPTYRAAQTETHVEKPSPKSSHQPSPYVSLDLRRFRGLFQTENSTRKGEQCHEQTLP